MEKLKPILAALVAGAPQAELRQVWIRTFPEDATKEEAANLAKHDKLRAQEKAAAKKAAQE